MSPGPTTTERCPGWLNRHPGSWSLVAALLVGDLWTKDAAFAHHLEVQGIHGRAQPVTVFDAGFCVVNLVREHNTGMAFGILDGPSAPAYLVAARVLVVGALLWLLARSPRSAQLQRIAIGTALAGALGNLADNLWTFDPAHPHAVRDFLHIAGERWTFPAFNLADACVAVGGMLLIWETLRQRRRSSPEAQP